MNKKVVVILGPTATGKSDLAVKLAKKINGEIISADSRQVYKGLDIGTGKITEKEMQNVPHYLLDVASPRNRFSVSKYKILAEKKIDNIIKRKKVPIICGGTGFYIDAVVNNVIFPDVEPDYTLRKTLERKTTYDLYRELYKIDRSRALHIDKNNRVRLIRAIEIAKKIGRVPKLNKQKNKYVFIKVGLFLPKESLQKKVYKRLIKRLNDGMITEVKKLHDRGLSYKRMEELGLEYRFLALYLQGKLTKEEMIEKLNIEIRKYAKRQSTWFKRDKEIHWFDVSRKIDLKDIIALLQKD